MGTPDKGEPPPRHSSESGTTAVTQSRRHTTAPSRCHAITSHPVIPANARTQARNAWALQTRANHLPVIPAKAGTHPASAVPPERSNHDVPCVLACRTVHVSRHFYLHNTANLFPNDFAKNHAAERISNTQHNFCLDRTKSMRSSAQHVVNSCSPNTPFLPI